VNKCLDRAGASSSYKLVFDCFSFVNCIIFATMENLKRLQDGRARV
jgi:hypothetical protein